MSAERDAVVAYTRERARQARLRAGEMRAARTRRDDAAAVVAEAAAAVLDTLADSIAEGRHAEDKPPSARPLTGVAEDIAARLNAALPPDDGNPPWFSAHGGLVTMWQSVDGDGEQVVSDWVVDQVDALAWLANVEAGRPRHFESIAADFIAYVDAYELARRL